MKFFKSVIAIFLNFYSMIIIYLHLDNEYSMNYTYR